MVRFGITALSRKFKNDAKPTEILLHKGIGQISVKTTEGDVISYDSMARFKSHIDYLTDLAINLNLFGKMQSITFDNIELPEVINFNQNLFNVPLLIKSNNFKKLLVSIDLDSVEVSSNNFLMEHEPFCKMTLLFKKDDDEREIVINKSINSFNRHVIDVEEYFFNEDMRQYEVYIKELCIRKNPYSTIPSVRNILHSILIIQS